MQDKKRYNILLKIVRAASPAARESTNAGGGMTGRSNGTNTSCQPKPVRAGQSRSEPVRTDRNQPSLAETGSTKNKKGAEIWIVSPMGRTNL